MALPGLSDIKKFLSAITPDFLEFQEPFVSEKFQKISVKIFEKPRDSWQFFKSVKKAV